MSSSATCKPHSVEYLLIFLLAFGLLAYFALNIPVAPDEGFYLVAAKLIVKDGRLPYLDFFFPQMPLQPMIYGLWFKAFGFSWVAARIFSSLLSAISILVLFELGRLSFGKYASYLLVVFFFLSNLCFPWLILAKPYAITLLALLLCTYYLRKFQDSHKLTYAFYSGIFISLAINCRSYTAVFLPFLLVAFVQHKVRKQVSLKGLVSLTAGALLFGLPALFFLLKDPDLFWFNNLGFHLNRTSLDTASALSQKVSFAEYFLGLRADKAQCLYQLPILTWLLFLGVFGRLLGCRPPTQYQFIALLLIIISFAPSPLYVQYFCLCLPFLLLAACETLFLLHNIDPFSRIYKVVSLCAFILLGSIYLYGTSDEIDTLFGSDRPRGNPSHEELLALSWNISSVRQVSKVLNQCLPKASKVVSLWPGYFFESELRPIHGLENQFGVTYLRKNPMQEAVQDKYRLLSLERVTDFVNKGRADAIISLKRKRPNRLDKLILKQGYTEYYSIGLVAIYVKDHSLPKCSLYDNYTS